MDPDQILLQDQGHPGQNGEISFVTKTLGAFQANSIPKFVSDKAQSYELCQGRGSFAGEETGGARALSQGTPRPDGLLQLQLPEIKE